MSEKILSVSTEILSYPNENMDSSIGTLASGGGILGLLSLFLLALVKMVQRNGCLCNSNLMSVDCTRPSVHQENVVSASNE